MPQTPASRQTRFSEAWSGRQIGQRGEFVKRGDDGFSHAAIEANFAAASSRALEE